MSDSVDVELEHLERLLAAAESVKNVQAKVGILAGATYPSGVPVADVAGYLEYGWVQSATPKQAGYLRAQGLNVKPGTVLNSPPRPIFATTAQTRSAQWQKTGQQMVLNADPDNLAAAVRRAIEMMCMMAQQDLQDAVIDGAIGGVQFAPRSAATLAMYAYQAEGGGHRISGANQTTTSKPLYRSGILAGSIAYEIKG